MSPQLVTGPNRFRISTPLPVTAPVSDVASDCRHYRGDQPCLHDRLCKGCEHYEPWQQRLCIIKLGPIGELVQALSVLPPLTPARSAVHLTWVTSPEACPLLDGHPRINRLLPLTQLNGLWLTQESFDIVINLDRSAPAAALAMALFARQKMGIGLSAQGTIVPLNDDVRELFQQPLTRRGAVSPHTPSYARLVHQTIGLPWRGVRGELPLLESQIDRARLELASRGWRPGCPTIGLDVSSIVADPNDMAPFHRRAALAHALRGLDARMQVLLLGGLDDRASIDRVGQILVDDMGGVDRVLDSDTELDARGFVAMVDACDAVVTGPSLTLHAAIGRRKGVVACLPPRRAKATDLFGLGETLEIGNDDDAAATDWACAVKAADVVAATTRVLAQVKAAAEPVELREVRHAG